MRRPLPQHIDAPGRTLPAGGFFVPFGTVDTRYASAYLTAMDTNTQPGTQTPWLTLRLTTGLSQREVERRMGWKRGHLSLVERGLPPTPDQAHQLRTFYLLRIVNADAVLP